MHEIFDVVDENDNVIGQATRKKIHDKKLIHRAVYFFILDKKRKNIRYTKDKKQRILQGILEHCFGWTS